MPEKMPKIEAHVVQEPGEILWIPPGAVCVYDDKAGVMVMHRPNGDVTIATMSEERFLALGNLPGMTAIPPEDE